MPISSKCHLKTALGHNGLNCGMEQCNNSTFCGKLAKHSDEKLSLRNLEKEEASIMKEIDEAHRSRFHICTFFSESTSDDKKMTYSLVIESFK